MVPNMHGTHFCEHFEESGRLGPKARSASATTMPTSPGNEIDTIERNALMWLWEEQSSLSEPFRTNDLVMWDPLLPSEAALPFRNRTPQLSRRH